MTWKKIKERKISVNNERYLWKRGHYKLAEYEYSDRAEKVLIYLKGFYSSPLFLIFKEDDNSRLIEGPQNKRWQISSWSANTGILYYESEELQSERAIVNLNKPSIIAKLIEYCRKSIWNPKESKEPTIIEDALLILDKIKSLEEKLKKKANNV